MSETTHSERLEAARRRASHTNRGKALEQLLDLVHKRYARAGHYVQRNGVPFVPMRGRPVNGKPVGTIGPEAPPDYLALSQGRAILFDAKSTLDSTWSFGLLERHQARSLDAWAEAGGIAGLVIAVDHMRVIGWVPWSELGPRWWAWHSNPGVAKRGTASLTADEVGRYACHGGDWMPWALSLSPVTTPHAKRA